MSVPFSHMACTLLVPQKNVLEMRWLVDDIKNGEDSTSWVAEYVFDSQIVSNSLLATTLMINLRHLPAARRA